VTSYKERSPAGDAGWRELSLSYGDPTTVTAPRPADRPRFVDLRQGKPRRNCLPYAV